MISGSSPCLLRLADERATGALLCDSGAIYLADGDVVHAESPAAPGIEILLAASGRLPGESWRAAVDQAGARRHVGRFLVDSGQMAIGELEICHLCALFDASYFVLSHGDGATRFRPGAEHWFGPLRPVRAKAVERESRRRRKLLDGLWPHPQVDTTPLVRRQVPGAPVVSSRQRAVLDLVDGERTPSAIARLLGRPAFHTLVDIRRLAAMGLIETPATALPSRPATSVASRAANSAGISTDLDIALLRRIRDALEARL
ncbi:transcriptional regulator [Streptomyces sp. NPDC054933]